MVRDKVAVVALGAANSVCLKVAICFATRSKAQSLLGFAAIRLAWKDRSRRLDRFVSLAAIFFVVLAVDARS